MKQTGGEAMNKDSHEQLYREAMELDWMTVYHYEPDADQMTAYHIDPDGDNGCGVLEFRLLRHFSDFLKTADWTNLPEQFRQAAGLFARPLRTASALNAFASWLDYGMNDENNCIALENQDADGFAAFIRKVTAGNAE